MIRLGSITIGGSASVVEARKKIRTVAIQLDCDEVEATRLATATSEIVRLYAQEGTTPRLEVSCDAQRPGTEIVLDFLDPEARPDVGHLVRFFDRIEYLAGEGETRVQRAIASMSPRSELRKSEIAKLEAIVQKKGRDELIAEIQKKNIELQESLDNLRRTRSAKERMESELNIGAEIQMSMLPLVFPAFPERADFDVYAALEPAREVGGDFYDFFLIDEDHLCVCIGDVSGKGVPAALFMAVTKTLVKSRASTDPSTASILGHVNQEMSQNNKESMFVTVFLGILRISTGEFIYSNAGHNPPYLLRGSGELIRLDRRHGPILGAVEGLSYGKTG